MVGRLEWKRYPVALLRNGNGIRSLGCGMETVSGPFVLYYGMEMVSGPFVAFWSLCCGIEMVSGPFVAVGYPAPLLDHFFSEPLGAGTLVMSGFRRAG